MAVRKMIRENDVSNSDVMRVKQRAIADRLYNVALDMEYFKYKDQSSDVFLQYLQDSDGVNDMIDMIERYNTNLDVTIRRNNALIDRLRSYLDDVY